MNAEFNWWLLIVGLGAGAAITWLVLSDLSHRDDDLTEREREAEVSWLAEDLARSGTPIPPDTISQILDAHRAYLLRDAPDVEDGQEEGGIELDEAVGVEPMVLTTDTVAVDHGHEHRADRRPETRSEAADPT